jgi:uncharacterized protein
MSLNVNLRHIEDNTVHLRGELPAEKLDLDLRDEIIRSEKPLQYDLEVQKMENALLVQGRLRLALRCECVRCLKPFEYALDLPKWTLHVPLEGEENAAVVNDCVDLTPYVREDILLEFPQHPLCEANCGGLPKTYNGKARNTSDAAQEQKKASAWSELDKLKL